MRIMKNGWIVTNENSGVLNIYQLKTRRIFEPKRGTGAS